jgi:hypothetical protein
MNVVLYSSVLGLFLSLLSQTHGIHRNSRISSFSTFPFFTLPNLIFSTFFFNLIVAINPNGRNYASGAEDGYVRLHFFDKSYLDMKDPVPEAAEGTEETSDEDEDNQGNE